MSTGTWDYDGPDPNKPDEWNTSDGLGLAGPVPSAFGGPNGEPVPPDPNDPDAGSNSGSGGGPYGQATRNDHKPLDAFGTSANTGADATDASADVNVTGANNVAGNSSAEAAEIAAVPDPQSPAGQAAILAIIEKYQHKSAGTVESSAATEQAHGSHAADSGSDSGSDRHHGDSSSGDGMGSGGGGGGLMGILSSLLGGGGSGLGGMNPFGQQGMPFGQQGMGGSPFGDPYTQQAGATQAADPFATPAGAPATQAASYKAADPFASTPSSGTASATNAGNTSADPFAASTDDTKGDDKGKTDDTGKTGDHNSGNTTASASSSGSGVDTSAFSGADGTAVPADPAATTS